MTAITTTIIIEVIAEAIIILVTITVPIIIHLQGCFYLLIDRDLLLIFIDTWLAT